MASECGIKYGRFASLQMLLRMGEQLMKAKILWGVLVVMMGTSFGMALDSGPDPICLPGRPCQIEQKSFDGGPVPICRPGIPCATSRKAFDGPIPICRPGAPCADHLIAMLGTAFSVATLDSGPDPICRPGKPCPVDQPAPSSGPEPLCRPGVPCPVGTRIWQF
jgi:hypothetical protein